MEERLVKYPNKLISAFSQEGCQQSLQPIVSRAWASCPGGDAVEGSVLGYGVVQQRESSSHETLLMKSYVDFLSNQVMTSGASQLCRGFQMIFFLPL